MASLALTRAQAYALEHAVRTASQPRRAYVYDEGADTWREVTVGGHSLEHPESGEEIDVTIVAGWVELYGGL